MHVPVKDKQTNSEEKKILWRWLRTPRSMGSWPSMLFYHKCLILNFKLCDRYEQKLVCDPEPQDSDWSSNRLQRTSNASHHDRTNQSPIRRTGSARSAWSTTTTLITARPWPTVADTHGSLFFPPPHASVQIPCRRQ